MGLDVQGLQNCAIQNVSGQIDAESDLPANQQLSKETQSTINKSLQPFNGKFVIQMTGAEPTIRITAVHLQNYFECALASLLSDRTIDKAIGIIHTKEATTPLQNPEGEIADVFLEKLNPVLKGAPDDLIADTLKTVTRRTESTRRLISLGSDVDFKLYVAFSKGGFERAQPIYKAEVENKTKNPNLVSRELTHEADKFGPDEIGATYVMKATDGKHLVLSVKAEQVKDAAGSETGEVPQQKKWTYWFGDLQNPEISTRYNHITDFLEKGGLQITLP